MSLNIKLDSAAAVQSLAKPVVVGLATVLFGPVGGAAGASIVDSPIGKAVTDAAGSAIKVTERDEGLQERLAKAVEGSLEHAFDIVGDETGSPIPDELRSQVISCALSGSKVAVSEDGRAYLHSVIRHACVLCHDGALMDDDLRGRVVETYIGCLWDKMREDDVLYRTLMAEVVRTMLEKLAGVSYGVKELQEKTTELPSRVDGIIREVLSEYTAREVPGMPQDSCFISEPRLAAYYDYVCSRFRDDNGSELYGKVPLRECYIEPTVRFGQGAAWSIRMYIERWLSGEWFGEENAQSIVVVCGEPGHGKTSLCRKAVFDFHEGGWLKGKVSNVLYFSLNPANTDAIKPDKSLDLYSLLSWGDNRRSSKHRIDEDDCKDALVFLDGFDELLEWLPKLDLGRFIREKVTRFQEDTGTHVVITSRSMAVDPYKRTYDVGATGQKYLIPILRMQPFSRKRQLKWIKECADYYRRLVVDESETATQVSRSDALKELLELENYLNDYRQRREEETLDGILGIPIIFRMVVAARYLPQSGEPIVQIYDNLFKTTWERHTHHVGDDKMEAAKKQLSRHALKVYSNDADTATIDNALESAWWLFSFYTTHDGRRRVGFLHRSFYQFFLAYEVVSWLKCYVKDANTELLCNNLSHLARRRLDKTTLGYIRDIHNNDQHKDSMSYSFDMLFEVLKKTDGFLMPSSDEENAYWISAVAPFERANNVFWNIVSVCSLCGHELVGGRVNARALRSYDLEGCCLRKATLDNEDLSGARLSGADLEEASLICTNLSRSNLASADLRGACLIGTDLTCANLMFAVLTSADLSGARLRKAFLNKADLTKGALAQTFFHETDLSGTDLSGANLYGATLEDADLTGANISRACLNRACLTRVALTHACIDDTDLEDASFWAVRAFGADINDTGLTITDYITDLRENRADFPRLPS